MAEEDYQPKSFMDRPKSRKGRSGGRKFTLPEDGKPRMNQYAEDRLAAAERAIQEDHEDEGFTLADLGPWVSKNTQRREEQVERQREEDEAADLESQWGDGPQLSDLKIGPDVIDLDYNPNDGYDDDDTGDYEEDDTGDYEEEPPEWNHDEENIRIYGGTPEEASDRANEDLHRSLQNADSSASDPDEDDPSRTIWHVAMPGGELKVFLVGEDGETHNITNRPRAIFEDIEDTGFIRDEG